jgi:hypothetical protein
MSLGCKAAASNEVKDTWDVSAKTELQALIGNFRTGVGTIFDAGYRRFPPATPAPLR